jgi:uncharacterized tellurite resistance protein B-like protein
MLGRIKEFFKGTATLVVDSTGAATSEDVQVATGVLLLEIAGADKDYDPGETRTIFRTLEKVFQIDHKRALELLEIADAARGEKQKIDEFIQCINKHFTPKQRQLVLAMVWKVVLADNVIDKFEARYATQLKFRLQLTDEHAAQAKQMAESGKV